MNAIALRDCDVMPSPRAEDDGEARQALSAATEEWAAGNYEGALRSLRRAAEIADEHEQDYRALELFKVAADLRSSIPPPPPSSPPPDPFPKQQKRLPPPPSLTMRLGTVPKPLPPPPRSNVREMPLRGVASPPLRARSTAALQAIRVAVSRGAGAEPRIVPLAAGAATPPNAVVALLVPTCAADSDAIVALLSRQRG